MEHAFSRHLALHTTSLFMVLVDVAGVVMALVALATHNPFMVVCAGALWAFAVGTVQFEVCRCAFAQVLPDYWELPRRILLQLGAFVGTITLVAASSSPELHGAYGRVFTVALSGVAATVAIGATRLSMTGWLALLWPILFVQLTAAGAQWRDPFLSLPTLEVALITATVIATAMWSMEPRRLARRFAGSRQTSGMDHAAARDVIARRADEDAATRARRTEPLGTVLLRSSARFGSTGPVADLFHEVAEAIGRYPLSWVVAGVIGMVAGGVLLAARADSMLFVWVGLLPAVAHEGRRPRIVLPIDRDMLFRRRFASLLLRTLLSVVMLAAIDAASRLAEAGAASLGRTWGTSPETLGHYPAVIFLAGLSGALLPTIREPVLSGLLWVILMLVGKAVDSALAGSGLVVRMVACLLSLAAAGAYVKAHFHAADL
jgi:hypothetical protein